MRISDWSSDVCSSDLRKARSATRNGTNAGIWRPSPLGAPDFSRNASREYMDIVAVDIGGTNARFAIASVEAGRVLKLGPPLTLKSSEERRVGKECVSTCRSRWSPLHEKKKNSR